MIDENAFGLLLSYHDVEDDEYGLERPQFVERFSAFRAAVLQLLKERPPGRGARALDLGHAIYIEVAEGDETEGPIGWLKHARASLAGAEFEAVCVLSHGSRWVDEEHGPAASTEWLGDTGLLTFSAPSEPLRRALYADAASRPDDEDESVGWGPGLYLDTEAVEALGKKPRNEPTVLRASGAAFYRAG
jgi:hypothetical protein